MRRLVATLRLGSVWIVVILALGLLVTWLGADAQPSVTRATIGMLTMTFGRPFPSLDSFVQELRERGWVEGLNLTIEERHAQRQPERLPALVAELVRLRVDVIFAASAPAIRAAKQATTTIPIVFETLSDAVAMGFVTNLVQPGGNVTGVTGFGSELGGKWLGLLREVVPGANHVAVLTNPKNPNSLSIIGMIERAAESLEVQLHIVEVRDPRDLDNAFAMMTNKGIDALIVPPDPLLHGQRQRVVELAATNHLPAIYGGEKAYMDIGGLLFYGTSLLWSHRRAAVSVDKILRGAKPGELAIERPTKFDLVINLKTAKALGLTIPPTLLFQANEVIQ